MEPRLVHERPTLSCNGVNVEQSQCQLLERMCRAGWDTTYGRGPGQQRPIHGLRSVSIPQSARRNDRSRAPEAGLTRFVPARPRRARSVLGRLLTDAASGGLVDVEPRVERLEADAERLRRAALVPVQLGER